MPDDEEHALQSTDDPPKPAPKVPVQTLRGLKSLVHDAVDGVTHLVGEGQDAVGRRVVEAGEAVGLGREVAAVETIRAAGSNLTLATVRGVNRLVEHISDTALDALGVPEEDPDPVPLRSDTFTTATGAADALVGVINGVVGDHLDAKDSRLSQPFALRAGERWLRLDAPLGPQLEAPSDTIVVLVHGLSATDASWCLDAERALGDAEAHYGAWLQRDLGMTPLYARYNSGLPVKVSGEWLAAAIAAVINGWPVEVRRVVLVGHSMGGLVCRAAIHQARVWQHDWIDRLTELVALGSPHQGAPLARGTARLAGMLRSVDTPGTQVVASLLDVRSQGIRDLQEGFDAEEFPALEHVRHAYFAGALTRQVNPVTKVVGDMLVPVRSAEGPTGGPEVFTARFPGVAHAQLQVNAEVYDALRAFLDV